MGLRGATISSFFQDFWEILEMGEIPRGATCPRGATSPAALAQVKGRRLRRPFLDYELPTYLPTSLPPDRKKVL